jgi:hypothetical protein
VTDDERRTIMDEVRPRMNDFVGRSLSSDLIVNAVLETLDVVRDRHIQWMLLRMTPEQRAEVVVICDKLTTLGL